MKMKFLKPPLNKYKYIVSVMYLDKGIIGECINNLDVPIV